MTPQAAAGGKSKETGKAHHDLAQDLVIGTCYNIDTVRTGILDYLRECFPWLAWPLEDVGFMEALWRIYGGCMEDLRRIYGGFMDDLWRIYGGIIDCFWMIYGRFMEGL
jgi:hypothetical protein